LKRESFREAKRTLEANSRPSEIRLLHLVKRQPLLDASLSDNDTSLLTPKDFPLFAAFKTLFSDSSPYGALGDPMKLDNLSRLISDRVTLLGLSKVQPLQAGDGMLSTCSNEFYPVADLRLLTRDSFY
jgi:hypothetical protein